MADVNADGLAKVEAGTGKKDVGYGPSQVQHMGDKYTFAANVFADTDRIKIGTLPKGAKIVGGYIRSEDLGTTGGFALGSTADADGIVTALTCTTAAGDSKVANGLMIGEEMAADTDIYLDCTAATDAANGKVIRAGVLFVKD